jgi:protein-S-isoprenylcysteine O-methyltransferase Ste14
MNLLKTLVFTIVVPMTVTVYLPWWLLAARPASHDINYGSVRTIGIIPIVMGALIYLRCAWDFATIGRGTPAPIDPPKELVVRGLYKYTRNPMYVGVASVLVGEAVFFEARGLFILTIVAVLMFHLFIVLYEEPTLRRIFGKSYARYCQAVPRWFGWRSFAIGQRESPRQ